jgi:hypothetical protein
MKIFYSFTFFLFTIIGFSQDYAGNYHKKVNSVNGELFEYSLNLNTDSSYTVEIHRNLNQKNSVDEFFKGKGKWKIVNKLILFFPELTYEKSEINMSEASARFDSKNKKALIFFNSKSAQNLNVGMEKID